MYNVYDLNLAYENFVGRFGIQPNALLMNEETFMYIYEKGLMTFDEKGNNPKFMNISILRSHQLETGKLRFVI